ncbi:hypothetical protein ACFOWE_07515 [Planomonospora corallina]|uniref:Ig-like domain (Group 3) n=1 Tax=Planomonospora corallina TaxID=1806052 RepID=A0ABV8I6T8_9ACTN
MRFTKSLAAAGALGLAVLTASPAFADDIDGAPAESAVSTTEAQEKTDAAVTAPGADAPATTPEVEQQTAPAADPAPSEESGETREHTKPSEQPDPLPEPAETTPATTPAQPAEPAQQEPPQAEIGRRPLIDRVDVTPGALVRGASYTVTVRTENVENGEPVLVRGVGGEKALGRVRDDRAVIRMKVPADARLGEHTVRAGIRGLTPGEAWIVVKPAPAAKLGLRLDPGTRLAGQSYRAVITTEKAKPGTVVTVKDPGGRTHRARLDARGTARITLTVPKGTKPGRHTVSATLPDGACDSAVLTVVKHHVRAGRIALDLTPDTVFAGGKFTALVATTHVAPGTKVTIYDPAGEPFTVKVDKNGTAIKKFHVPSSTDAGSYWFTAKLPNGQKSSAKLTVLTWKVKASHDYTPRGGAQTGGGRIERNLAANPSATGGSALGSLVLGGALIAGGSGAALFSRRFEN